MNGYFYGVPSVGKTTLLRKIQYEYSNTGVRTAFINFSNFSQLSTGETSIIQNNIVKRLMAGIARKRTPRYNNLIRAHSYNVDLDKEIEKLLESSLKLHRINKLQSFALFFDAIEDCNRDILIWIQEKIIRPFMDVVPTLVLISGHMPLNTIERDLIYSLERRTVQIRLEPFNDYQTDRQISAIGAKNFALQGRELRHYTGGIPGLNTLAVHWSRGKQSQQFVTELRPYLVDKVIFEQLASRKVSRDIKDEILAVTPLRQFDSGLLGKVARDLFPEKHIPSGISPIRELLNRLQEADFVEPHPDGYGYTVPSHLRMVLSDYWQQMQPRRHIKVHKIAARWFETQFQHKDFVAIADRLYHLAAIWQDVALHPELAAEMDSDLQPQPSASERLVRELQAALETVQRDSTRTFDIVNKIRRILNKEEFHAVLGIELAHRLSDICEAFNDGLA